MWQCKLQCTDLWVRRPKQRRETMRNSSAHSELLSDTEDFAAWRSPGRSVMEPSSFKQEHTHSLQSVRFRAGSMWFSWTLLGLDFVKTALCPITLSPWPVLTIHTAYFHTSTNSDAVTPFINSINRGVCQTSTLKEKGKMERTKQEQRN
jgi:hypothetical protein